MPSSAHALATLPSAAAKAWEADKHPFSYGKASEAFLKTLQLIGVNIDHLLAKEIRQ